MTSAPRVLYLVICGTPAASGAHDFIRELQTDGWEVCAVTTPMGSRFVNATQLAELTGHPVRSTYKNPDDPDVLPPGDVFVVAPASFNTVNKLANGISDTLGVGLVCEGMGAGRPVIVAPWTNPALANHSAYGRSIQQLHGDGVHLVLVPRTEPGASLVDAGGAFAWDNVLREVRKLSDAAD